MESHFQAPKRLPLPISAATLLLLKLPHCCIHVLQPPGEAPLADHLAHSLPAPANTDALAYWMDLLVVPVQLTDVSPRATPAHVKEAHFADAG